jgi:hypothetical protein
MFVWVAVGGVMSAVERLDVAGSRLLINSTLQQNSSSTRPPAAAAGGGDRGSLTRHSLIFNRQPSRLGLEARHLQQQQQQHQMEEERRQQQQQQQQAPGLGVSSLPPLLHHAMRRVSLTTASQPTLPLHTDVHQGRGRHHHQQQQQQQSQAPLGTTPTTAGEETTQAAAAAVAAAAQRPAWHQGVSQVLSALLILPVLTNIAGFWRARALSLRDRALCKKGEASNSSRYATVVLLLVLSG